MENDIWRPYQQSHPDEFRLLGTDVMSSGTNGVLLAQFRLNAGGLTFPLLRDCADGSALSDTNLIRPYNQRDNYVVIDADGIIRYHADDAWDYGNRLHLDELNAAITAALADLLADAPPRSTGGMALAAAPNPFTRRVVLTLTGPSPGPDPPRFRVFDPAGREVADLDAGSAGAGSSSVVWDAHAADGRPLSPGLYLVRVESGTRWLTRRIVLTR